MHPSTKKRRMLGIVVSRFSAVFQRLMLLEYQIGLDFASGMCLGCADRITNRAQHKSKNAFLHHIRHHIFDFIPTDMFHIHRIINAMR